MTVPDALLMHGIDGSLLEGKGVLDEAGKIGHAFTPSP
jgi:hypothetical protein